jgi:excisionase family DNA binding protein
MNKPTPVKTPLLTINEVARQENVSPRTVRRQIVRGDLPYYRIGRAIRISPEDLAACLKGSGENKRQESQLLSQQVIIRYFSR